MATPSHPHGTVLTLTAAPLTAAAFAPYGDVIEATGPAIDINQGKGRRYADLAHVDVTTQGGRAAVSLMACTPEAAPVRLRLMERHPLGSQTFVPLDGQRYLVVVARAGDAPEPEALRAFLGHGPQGVNYHRGTWHHPMIVLDAACRFVEVHRAGPGDNCDEAALAMPVEVRLPESDSGNPR